MADRYLSALSPLARAGLEALADDHRAQRALCDDLERLADRLPAIPSASEVGRLGRLIRSVTGTPFARAEETFASLPDELRPGPAALAALRQMHELDQMHGEDLIVALWQHVGRVQGSHVGQLAYMLRCFFDGCRRAVAMKESWIGYALRASIRAD